MADTLKTLEVEAAKAMANVESVTWPGWLAHSILEALNDAIKEIDNLKQRLEEKE